MRPAEGWEWCEARGVHESPGATVTKYRRLGGLNNRNVLPHSSGD